METGIPIGTVVTIALLTLLPFALLATTSFAKMSVVLMALRNALGFGAVPSAMVVTLLAALLSALVMAPVFDDMVAAGSEPAARVDLAEPLSADSRGALAELYRKASQPLRAFLDRHIHPEERALLLRLAGESRPGRVVSPDDLTVLLPAFLLSELSEAFQLAFLILLPFVVVDLVVASVLTALGMPMLSPVTISLPIKLLLFVLLDGFLVLSEALVKGYL